MIYTSLGHFWDHTMGVSGVDLDILHLTLLRLNLVSSFELLETLDIPPPGMNII